MKSNITKIRNYKQNLSFGITKEIADFQKEEGNEWFIMRCSDKGVVCFIPLKLLNDELNELEGDIL